VVAAAGAIANETAESRLASRAATKWMFETV